MIVDDEPDVLETLIETLLDVCCTSAARSWDQMVSHESR